MARNSGGTYTLPSGNPVTTGTTISSTWANNTLSDLASEMTNSLDRQGRGAMTAALQATSGTITAPGITFDGDTNTGIYRPGADTLRVTAGGTAAIEATSAAVSALVPVGLPDGQSSAPALYFTSAADTGVYLDSGVPNWRRNDGVTTSSVLKTSGTIDMSGQGQITKTSAIAANILCKERIPTCWGIVDTDGAGNVAITDGNNIATVTLPGANVILVSFATAMTTVNYAVIVSARTTTAAGFIARTGSRLTNQFELVVYDDAAAAINPATGVISVDFVVFGGR